MRQFSEWHRNIEKEILKGLPASLRFKGILEMCKSISKNLTQNLEGPKAALKKNWVKTHPYMWNNASSACFHNLSDWYNLLHIASFQA